MRQVYRMSFNASKLLQHVFALLWNWIASLTTKFDTSWTLVSAFIKCCGNKGSRLVNHRDTSFNLPRRNQITERIGRHTFKTWAGDTIDLIGAGRTVPARTGPAFVDLDLAEFSRISVGAHAVEGTTGAIHAGSTVWALGAVEGSVIADVDVKVTIDTWSERKSVIGSEGNCFQ